MAAVMWRNRSGARIREKRSLVAQSSDKLNAWWPCPRTGRKPILCTLLFAVTDAVVVERLRLSDLALLAQSSDGLCLFSMSHAL